MACVLLGACSGGRDGGRAPTTVAPAGDDASVASRPAALAGAAVDVALAYVASTDELMGHSPVGRREIIRRLATSTSAGEQLASFEQTASELADTMGVPVERLSWVEAPITTHVVTSAADSASVDVWTVSILGAPDAGSPQQVWRTVHVDLVLTSGGWRVDAASAEAGPTPASNELSLQSTFADFEVVAGWTPVVEGVAP
ncbi:MAG: hypothetical protein QM733_23610 [Ilumatobacteraceae bacterium]